MRVREGKRDQVIRDGRGIPGAAWLVDHVLDDVLAVHASMECCMMRSEVDAWTRWCLCWTRCDLLGWKPCRTQIPR